MATNSGDLTQTLIEGGLAPQAARAIANAIANAHSGTFSRGRDVSDATPTDQLRMITADTRRYQLTNLDFSPAAPFQDRLSSNPGEYAGPAPDHPYKDSQPLVSAPPLSSPRVQGSDYIAVSDEVTGNSAVSRIGLRLRQQTGRHLRIDPSTKFLDALPLNAISDTPRFVSAEFSESDESSNLRVSLRNLEEISVLLSDGNKQSVWAFPEAVASAPAAESMPGLANAILRQGTWTPAFFAWATTATPPGVGTNPNLSYNTDLTAGRYFRIGPWVYVNGRIVVSAVVASGTGYIGVRNLPFAVQSGEFFSGSISYKNGFSGAGPDFVYAQDTTTFNATSGRADCLVLGYHTATSVVISQQGMLSGGIDFGFSCIYRTAAA
jgi:hypothetical protein